MKKIYSGALAAVCVLGFGAANAAGAQDAAADAPKLVVQYSPASLASEQGVHQLYRRLLTAANKVCDVPQIGKFESPAVTACRKQAIAGAVAQIHNARLADLSAGNAKNG